jgi:hypothetical protein
MKYWSARTLESVSLWSNEEARSADKIIAWAVRPRETSPYRSSAEGAVDFENRPSQRDSVPNGSGLAQFADIAHDNKATISAAPSALLAFISHSLGLTAQAIILSALRASFCRPELSPIIPSGRASLRRENRPRGRHVAET